MLMRAPSEKSSARGTVKKVIKIGLIAGLLGLVMLIAAVFIQASTLPSFNELKASPQGQMIRVRAADGSVLVSLGPSFGEWLSYDEIPPIMVEAMVAVEDRRDRKSVV